MRYLDTRIFEALAANDTDTIKVLLESGANVNACEEFGCTPLHRAANQGRRAVVFGMARVFAGCPERMADCGSS
jgi:ankyrin repeat protein